MIGQAAIAIGAAQAALAAGPAAAQPQTAPLQGPADVSPRMGKIIGLPLRTNWDIHPKDGAAWTLRRSAESRMMRARWMSLRGRERSFAVAARRAVSATSESTQTI